MARTVFLRRAPVENDVLVARVLHQILEQVDDLERHREDEDLVALAVPDLEQLAKDLREQGLTGASSICAGLRRTVHLPHRFGSRKAIGPGVRFSKSSGKAARAHSRSCSYFVGFVVLSSLSVRYELISSAGDRPRDARTWVDQSEMVADLGEERDVLEDELRTSVRQLDASSA